MKLLKYSRYIQISIWIVILLITYYSSQFFLPQTIAFVRSLFTVSVLAAIFYSNVDFLLQRYWPSRKLMYYMGSVLLLVLSIFIRYLSERYFFKLYVGNSEFAEELVNTGLVRLIITSSLAYAFSFLHHIYQKHMQTAQNQITDSSEVLLIKTGNSSVKIQCDKIVLVEAMREYVRIHMDEGSPIVTYKRMTEMEEELPDYFLRTHRSNIINLHKVTGVSTKTIALHHLEAKLSQSFKNEFSDRWQDLQKYRLN